MDDQPVICETAKGPLKLRSLLTDVHKCHIEPADRSLGSRLSLY